MPTAPGPHVSLLPDQNGAIWPLSPTFHAMESPYVGWIVPHEWQEPGYNGDDDPETTGYPDDCDAEGYLIDQN